METDCVLRVYALAKLVAIRYERFARAVLMAGIGREMVGASSLDHTYSRSLHVAGMQERFRAAPAVPLAGVDQLGRSRSCGLHRERNQRVLSTG